LEKSGFKKGGGHWDSREETIFGLSLSFLRIGHKGILAQPSQKGCGATCFDLE
jgi:hypothetical protein